MPNYLKTFYPSIHAQLLKTGQTTRYNDYPDDGYYQKGISKQYQILDMGQYTGTVNMTLNAKTDIHSNNCVKDLKTGLIWSRHVSASVGPASDGRLPWTTNENGEGIFSYADAANVALLAGYSDWRIPNLFELASLLNPKEPNAAPDPTAFPSWQLLYYIATSTTKPNGTDAMLGILFGNSTILDAPKTNPQFVALVRG